MAAIGVGVGAAPVEIGKPGITPAPCPDQPWEETDSTFAALPGARVSFGHYEGGAYRIEIPAKWNGELVLWAHGYTANAGEKVSRGLPPAIGAMGTCPAGDSWTRSRSPRSSRS